MRDFDFDRVVYRGFKLTKPKRYIKELIGIDSEAYPNGTPFLFSTSLGDDFAFEDIPQCFFTRKYRGAHFATWNLKYDSGALIYNLPGEVKEELRVKLKVRYKGYTYHYIPDKMLRITRGKNSVNFWDIMPFYNSSLNAAAQKYLGKSKIGLNPKLFTIDYVKLHLPEIKDYCRVDAELTAELGKRLLSYFAEWGIKPAYLYSIASISFRYFQQNCDIVGVGRFWKLHQDLLRFACEAYKGGKFEVTQRGRFNAYEYDINSCYPFEVANLLDIRHAKVVHTPEYQTDAQYGFLRVKVVSMPPCYHPIAIKIGNINIYPMGCFDSTITKQEYDYILTLGAEVAIVDAYWLKMSRFHYPYRKIVEDLYARKTLLKGKDDMGYNLVKIMLNGFYGKMVQMIKQADGTLKAGVGWNPIYGAIVTANARIRMSKIQNTFDKGCLAVHTDSVILDKAYLHQLCCSKLGGWSLTAQGDTLIIGSGIYQIGDKVRIRGFPYDGKVDLIHLLKDNLDKYTIKLPSFIIQSWRLACFRGKFKEVNLPIDSFKVLDLNCDSKRVWLRPVTSRDLLDGANRSVSRIVMLSKFNDITILDIAGMDRKYGIDLTRYKVKLKSGEKTNRRDDMLPDDRRMAEIERLDRRRDGREVYQRGGIG